MDAIPLLERAIAVDPQFALAYTTLSSLYGGLGETGRSEEFAGWRTSTAIASASASACSSRTSITTAYTGDQLKTREALEVWKRTYPRDYRPANALAVLLNRLGDYPGAVARSARRRSGATPRTPSRTRTSRMRIAAQGRYAEARRRGGTGDCAEPRDRADAPPPLPGCRNRRRRGGRAPAHRMGVDPQPRASTSPAPGRRWRHSADG